MTYMLERDHVCELLPAPEERHKHVLVTAVTNDATSQYNKKQYRSVLAASCFVHTFVRRYARRGGGGTVSLASQVYFVHDDPDSVARARGPEHDIHHAWGIWDCGEKAETFFAMFVHDKFFASELQKYVEDNYLFKRHVVLLICDGAAMAHHAGTSGHAVRCGVCTCLECCVLYTVWCALGNTWCVLCVQGVHGCNHCTVAKEFKHLIPQDYDVTADPKMQAVLGVPRTKAGTAAAMAQFELDLAAEMNTNKERYVDECGGGNEGLEAYNLWAGVPGLGHMSNHPCHCTVRLPSPPPASTNCHCIIPET